ncbi:COMM domain-containing protein 10 [Frankliniella fusca]|uniref:COMM domain-containing protein 10 n=1 Tax=Frankliniella fusca TaxID=407009 RepID=A0AAE1I700_9NEOP|nr:COMM domain-containing protein 10 [Frankliniella fusca]
MTSSWIQITPKFQEGLNLINTIEPAKLRLLLNRIASFMQGETSEKASPFTGEEEAKLEKSLGFESKEVALVVDSCSLILQQAAYYAIKPEVLKTKLIDGLKLEQERSGVIVSVWSLNANLILESLRRRSVLPYQLADLSWLLNVETSSKIKSRSKEPVAVLELLLKSNDIGDTVKVKLEMQKAELQNFYQNLEKIQAQLDGLK